MTAETNAAENGGLSWKAFKDTWFPPETALTYRCLTCVSKSVEAALALGCLAGVSVSVITGHHPDLHLILGGAAGAATCSVNTALDVFTTLNNRERNVKQK